MKHLTIFIFFCFLSSIINAQENIDSVSNKVEQITTEKLDDYYGLIKVTQRFSLKELKELYKESKKSSFIIGQLVALNRIGKYHRSKTDYELALENHKKALDIAIAHKLKDIEVSCLNQIGVVYRRIDDIKNALGFHQSAISISKRIKSPTIHTKVNISIAQNSIGNIYSSLQQYEKAIEQFNKALVTQTENLNFQGLAINFQNIGTAFEGLNMFDKAMENYKVSLEYNEKLNSDYGKVICVNSITSVLIAQGKYKKALQTINSIVPLTLKVNNPNFLIETYSNLGLSHLKLEDYEKASKNFDNAIGVMNNFKVLNSHKIKLHFNLSELYKKLNNYKMAYDYFQIATEEEKQTLGLRNSIYVNNLISKQDLEHKINEFNDLQKETQIKSLQLARNRNILIITLVTIGLLSIVLYSMYRQNLLKNDQNVMVLEQQALQAQMNPHFIFNALNSIKHYIINNEQKNAVYYLNKFSKLIRNILEVSKVKEVSLKEELSTISLYMSIENIRFSNGINYTEKIDPDLKIDTIKLPPLVLQPFLENSIWHGLSSKEGDKSVVLEANKISEASMEVNIIDNGVGRVAAEKIKKKKSISLSRKSVGVDLTVERLVAFYNEFSDQFSLTYYDLKDDKGNPSGTKVTLVMPLA